MNTTPGANNEQGGWSSDSTTAGRPPRDPGAHYTRCDDRPSRWRGPLTACVAGLQRSGDRGARWSCRSPGSRRSGPVPSGTRPPHRQSGVHMPGRLVLGTTTAAANPRRRLFGPTVGRPAFPRWSGLRLEPRRPNRYRGGGDAVVGSGHRPGTRSRTPRAEPTNDSGDSPGRSTRRSSAGTTSCS